MALSYTAYTGNGVLKDFPISFEYIDKAHISVKVNGTPVSFITDTVNKVVRLNTAPVVGARVLISRETPITRTYSDFTRGNAFGQSNVNNSFLWQLMISQELAEGRHELSHVMLENLNMGYNKVINAKDAELSTDLAPLGQVKSLIAEVVEKPLPLWSHVSDWTTDPFVTESNQVIPYHATNQLFRPRTVPYQVDSNSHPDPNALLPDLSSGYEGELLDVSSFIGKGELERDATLSFSSISEMLGSNKIIGSTYTSGRTKWKFIGGDHADLSNYELLSDFVFEDYNLGDSVNVKDQLDEATKIANTYGKWVRSDHNTYSVLDLTFSVPVKLKGSSTFQAYIGGMYIGQNMFNASNISGFRVKGGMKFDGRNDVLRHAGATDEFDNIFNFMSCKNVDIERTKQKRAVRHFIWANATLTNRLENFRLFKNKFEDGVFDAVMVRRYGTNIDISWNEFVNPTDSSKTGDIAGKSVAVSGSEMIRIRDNVAESDGSSSCTFIVEYIDVRSVNVEISGNVAKGSSSNGFKVGASDDVTVKKNRAIGCDSGYYFEGCTDLLVIDNRAVDTKTIAYFVTRDADTGADNFDVKLLNNWSKNANTSGLPHGTPPQSSGNKYSYHIWVENAERVSIDGNILKDDSTNLAGGIAVACQYDSIVNNDVSGINSGCVAFYSSYADGERAIIENNRGMQTTNFGEASVASGSSQKNVIPDIIGTQYSSQVHYFNAVPNSALSGSIAYWNVDKLDWTTWAIRTRNSAHGAANVIQDTEFYWEARILNPKGVFGKTIR